jgi:Gluconate 2-dehydrogenase subunit 3
MDRRDLLKSIAMLTGGAVIGAEFFLSGCKNEAAGTISFTDSNVAFLNEVADTILPTTAASPGAKAAKVGEFIKVYVTDCYEKENQDVFSKGIITLDESCKKANGKSFTDCTPEVKTKFLKTLDAEMKAYQKTKPDKQKVIDDAFAKNTDKKAVKEVVRDHYFKMMKDLTLFGYFSSEVGCTKAMNWVQVPGKFDGAFAYKKGDKAYNG